MGTVGRYRRVESRQISQRARVVGAAWEIQTIVVGGKGCNGEIDVGGGLHRPRVQRPRVPQVGPTPIRSDPITGHMDVRLVYVRRTSKHTKVGTRSDHPLAFQFSWDYKLAETLRERTADADAAEHAADQAALHPQVSTHSPADQAAQQAANLPAPAGAGAGPGAGAGGGAGAGAGGGALWQSP